LVELVRELIDENQSIALFSISCRLFLSMDGLLKICRRLLCYIGTSPLLRMRVIITRSHLT